MNCIIPHLVIDSILNLENLDQEFLINLFWWKQISSDLEGWVLVLSKALTKGVIWGKSVPLNFRFLIYENLIVKVTSSLNAIYFKLRLQSLCFQIQEVYSYLFLSLTWVRHTFSYLLSFVISKICNLLKTFSQFKTSSQTSKLQKNV